MIDLFNNIKINRCKSFNPTEIETDYKLVYNQEYDILTSEASNILNTFIRTDQISISLRGVTKDAFFRDYELYKFFIVGDKGKWYKNETEKNLNNIDKSIILKETNDLITNINRIINEKKHHGIRGELKLLDNSICIDDLKQRRLFLLSVLHNIGNRWTDKSISPFMSLTTGSNALNIAYKFCKPSINTDEIGFIFVYFLCNNSPYYIKTIDMNLKLSELGVSWYEDINSEWIVADGVLPHQLMGIIELTSYENKEAEFILNPWLALQLKKYRYFNPLKGIKIDQTNFSQCAESLGYKKFYSQYDKERIRYKINGEIIGTSDVLNNYDNKQ